jgi:magnesium transporter
MTPKPDHLQQPILEYVRKDFAALPSRLTVQQALDSIRQKGLGEKIVYFYVVDEQERLVGVLPTRRLLTAPLETTLRDLMISRLVSIPATATVLDACEFFVLHKYLAFPVVDDQRRLIGIVDVALFTGEVFDLAERSHLDDVFETIGFRVSQVRDASPWRAFRFRFPWLLATISSGLVCALLSSAYEATIAKTILLAFFLTLVLALSESVSIQSMTVTVQALRTYRPTWSWFFTSFRRESATSILIGLGCGLLVGLVVGLWHGSMMAGAVIGGSIFLSLSAACSFGLVVPTVLHSLKLDPKIAAGPLTLALADITTLLFYFNLGRFFL